jgi:SAM-dependent methyltransferase
MASVTHGRGHVYERYTSSTALATQALQADLAYRCVYFERRIAPLLPDSRDAVIGDVGCGYGAYLVALQRLGYARVEGCDISPEQVATAHDELGLGDEVALADAEQWLLERPGKFDCLLGFDLLEHLPLDSLLALGAAIRQSLRPGGRFIAQVPNALSPLNPFAAGDVTHVRVFTPQSLGQTFRLWDLRPVEFREAAPIAVNARSAAKALAWKWGFRPAIRAFVTGVHGRVPDAVFTSNVIGVATRDAA